MATGFPDLTLRRGCHRFLGGHGRVDQRRWAERMLASPYLDDDIDIYNAGPAMQRLEAESAELLGKPAALFFHKGVSAQLAALLVHAEASNRRVIALHPRSHIARDEKDPLDRLCGLTSRRVGVEHAPFTAEDLTRLAEPLGAVTVELPIRQSGFIGTPWDDLTAISTWARSHGVPFHIDGARIWESAPWYGKSLAEIAALADSVYVSFYKGLGGMGGCVLAGSEDFVAAAKPWRTRLGGDMPTIFPYVITALDGLHHHLPRMPEYYAHACAIAAAITGWPGLAPFPEQPHGNSFRILFDVAPDRLEAAATKVAQDSGTWLANAFHSTGLPRQSFLELVVGEATLGWTAGEVAEKLANLRAAALSAA